MAGSPRTSTPRAAPDAIVLDGVTKQYRGGGGVDDLSLTVTAGEVFGFLGPNGAGKTTTIRMLVDLIRPDRGSITVLGERVTDGRPELRRRIGYLPGDLALWDRLTGAQILTHLAHLRGGVDDREVHDLCDRFDVELSKPAKTLSRGNRQKIGIVQALMGRPDLLILDEPTSGLDPLVQAEFHRALREAGDRGCTVFLSSHTLSEVDRVADRVGMVRDGRIAAVEEVTALRGRAVHRIEIRTGGEFPSDALAALDGARRIDIEHDTARLEWSGGIAPLLGALAPLDVIDLTIHEPDLEDVFLELYREPAAT